MNIETDYIITESYACLQHSLIMYTELTRDIKHHGVFYHSVYNKGIVKHNKSIWINDEEKINGGGKWNIYNYK